MKLVTTVAIKDKDYSLLARCQSFIVTNNYYNGVSLYSPHLEHLKDISCFKDSAIHTIFTSFTKKEILLYLREEDKIIYLDLITEKHETIKLAKYASYNLSSFYYWWENNIAIIPVQEDELFKLDLKKKQFSTIDAEELKRDFYSFYLFWQKVKDLWVVESDIPHQVILYRDKEKPLATIKHLITNKEYSCTIPQIDVHDITFKGATFAFVAEYDLVIKNARSGKEITLKPKPFNRFLRLIFLDENQVVLLSCEESGTGIDFLQLYDISELN